MSKQTNTFFFILAATFFNVVITIINFLVILLIYTKFIYPLLPENSIAWALPVIFILSIAVSFLVYRFAIKLMLKKVDMEKYFAPMFGKRKS
jgi:membrane protein implicated in regulation of membrane protease activity